MQELKLPDLGEGMHEAEIVQRLVKPGDTIKLDQTMVKVETDKAVVEIPSPVAGRVAEIRFQDGQVAKVGDVLVVFETSAKGDDSTPSQDSTAIPATTQPPGKPSPSPTAQTATTKQRVLAAPAVRKLAFELGIDLEQDTPTNPNGRVTIEDVRSNAEQTRTPSALPASSSALAEQPVPLAQDEREPLT